MPDKDYFMLLAAESESNGDIESSLHWFELAITCERMEK